MSRKFQLHLRRQELHLNDRRRNQWFQVDEVRKLPGERLGLLLCDVWNHHWCRGARERLDEMVFKMNEVVKTARDGGISIIHAPSGTMDFYAETRARKRMLEVPAVNPPENLEHEDPPLPIDDTDRGSDTGESKQEERRTYSKQHVAIGIDEDRDVISDDGRQVYSFLKHRGIDHLLILGVHTNMCILHRSFGIKQMTRWGLNMVLLRDLTDTMYNPAMRPYVDHEEGTRLVIEFIEKFWCPTILSEDLKG